MKRKEVLVQLSEFIHTHQTELVEDWWNACEQDALLQPVGKLTREEFRNNIPAAIEGFRTILISVEDELMEVIRKEVAKHGHHRWRQGFNLRELIRDWGHLNRTLIRVIERFFESIEEMDTKTHQEGLDRLALFMTEATSGSVRRYDELRQEEALALEKEIKEAEKQFDTITKERSRLLREAAHDLHGSLSALVLHSRLFRDSEQISPSVEDVLEKMDRGLNSVSEMLRSLLDLTRLESGKETLQLSAVNLSEIVEGLAAEFESAAVEKGIELLAEGTSRQQVTTDPEKVKRIAQNLIVNALQHTAEGFVKVCWEIGSDSWELLIQDTGPGMQAKKGSQIAQELDETDSESAANESKTTFAYSGEGIGLTIVKRLCDLLHASIHLNSVPGEGSTFVIKFPMDYS
jgi:signal transduction histidine kinase